MDIIEHILNSMYPVVASITSGAGGYWLTTQIMQSANNSAAMAVGFIAAAAVFSEVMNDE